MIADSNPENLCQRIESSVQRVVNVRNFSCIAQDGKLILRGQVESRDEAVMCIVVARSVPGVETVVSEVKVTR